MKRRDRVIEYRRILNSIRGRIFDYEDSGKRSKAERVMGKLKRRIGKISPVRRKMAGILQWQWGE